MRRLLLAATLLGAPRAFAGEVVDRVAATLASPPLLRGRFEQVRTVPGFAQPVASSGTFVLVRGVGLLWRTTTPVATTLAVTPTSVTVEQGGRVRSRVEGARASSAIGWLLPLLDGELATLERDFRVDGSTGANGWTLALAPLDTGPRRAVTRIELAGDRHVRRIALVLPSGERTELRIVDVQAQPAPLTTEERGRLE